MISPSSTPLNTFIFKHLGLLLQSNSIIIGFVPTNEFQTRLQYLVKLNETISQFYETLLMLFCPPGFGLFVQDWGGGGGER